ncbi:uncharacterized protein LOC134210523 [Armigeres subalbatus]|uniref:uncharacterized protein LOC134210523 n=1 Tax=Armigeres subalbatus TaxID=124917 RepID=UPI002ED4DFAF
MEIEKILREKRIEMDRILKEKQLKINNELREKELQLEKEMLEKALHEEQVYADRMQQMRESYQNAIENMKTEKWPFFIGSYEASNEACGCNDVENLVRLQDSVRGQLLLPKSVPKVINKLRQLYGRSEQLLHFHLGKVKQLDPPKADRLETFIPFGNVVEQLCDHLIAAELKEHLINPLLIQDLVDKLPAGDKREWVRYRSKRKTATLRTFSNFISKIVTEACAANVSLENRPGTREKLPVHASKGKAKEKGAVYSHSTTVNPSNDAAIAEKKLKPCRRMDHRLRFCQDFKVMSFAERDKIVERGKLCKICLNDHGNALCKFKIRCNVGQCHERHHPLLHPSGHHVVMNTHIRASSAIQFRMIPVKLHQEEKNVTTLAFFDEGSSITLVECSLVNRRGAEGVKWSLTIKWTADISREEHDSRMMNLWISAVGQKEKLLLQSAQTVHKLLLPKQSLNSVEISAKYSHLRNLPLASYSDQQPGLLIGLNNLHTIAPNEAKIRRVGEPIAVRSKLGWSVYGPTSGQTDSTISVNHHHGISNDDLYNLLKKHYSLEESAVEISQETKDEKRARGILERTTVRIGDRFETGLLWKSEDRMFPDRLAMARGRLKQLEQRLEKSPEMYDKIRKQVEGYAHLATSKELAETDSHLPLRTCTLVVLATELRTKPEKAKQNSSGLGRCSNSQRRFSQQSIIKGTRHAHASNSGSQPFQ